MQFPCSRQQLQPPRSPCQLQPPRSLRHRWSFRCLLLLQICWFQHLLGPTPATVPLIFTTTVVSLPSAPPATPQLATPATDALFSLPVADLLVFPSLHPRDERSLSRLPELLSRDGRSPEMDGLQTAHQRLSPVTDGLMVSRHSSFPLLSGLSSCPTGLFPLC